MTDHTRHTADAEHRDDGRPDVPTFPGSDVPLRGTIAGVVPYDFTVPTPAKIRERLWNPHSDNLLGPHTFGIGWTPNFGAVAVALGLIEPDAEDDPLDTYPGQAWAAALALPVAFAGALAVFGRRTPTPVSLLAAACTFATAGAALYGLAISGREVERRRDLGG